MTTNTLIGRTTRLFSAAGAVAIAAALLTTTDYVMRDAHAMASAGDQAIASTCPPVRPL